MNTAVQVENSFNDTNMSNHKCMCPCMDIIIRVKCQASNSIKSLIAFTNTTNKVNTNQDNPDEALTFLNIQCSGNNSYEREKMHSE